jgi:hypothetical protein
MSDLAGLLKIDLSVVSGNIQDFFIQVIKPNYRRMVRDSNPLRRMLLCKEEKEQLIKSKMRALVQLYVMVNSLTDAELKILDDFRAESEDDVMDT